ncbi:hypothetical protein RJ640_015945 [Escallonia rubra]|uniref:Transducin beta-like protein 2 n=1 Tax=Escallonia rubra TaxID=112253 RepID=A0AA88RAK6_9ASTE|nr:hypothetical protein RJ640_015945 [Escallonia rubra]
MDAAIPIAVLSVLIGGLIALLFFGNYFGKKKLEVEKIAKPIQKPPQKPSSKKSHPRPHSHAADKVRRHFASAFQGFRLGEHCDLSIMDNGFGWFYIFCGFTLESLPDEMTNVNSSKDLNKRHHPLDLNTLKGHGDSVSGLCFSSDGHCLATACGTILPMLSRAVGYAEVCGGACGDGVVRVFKLDDASSKSFKFLRINLPAGALPAAVSFVDDASSVVVASHGLSGSSLYMYAEEKPKSSGETKQQSKLPLPEIKWERHKVHDRRAILTLVGSTATYGSADGSTIIASCSEGTDIILWHGRSGKNLAGVDTNQLKNNMATISPNGRFIAAAAFTADVKVWEIVYSKDGSVKEVLKAMQLKGHKSAVTWLCFTPNSEQVITASKDGSIRLWNINVRYHLDEDPKTLKVFPIPLHDSKGSTLHYDRLSISPDGRILAATHGSLLQWLCAETGQVLDTADKAHDGDITDVAWAPRTIPTGDKQVMVLATAGVDKKVKLWAAPPTLAS